ncbi:MAG: OmpA family protein [Bacteroidota bacterium]
MKVSVSIFKFMTLAISLAMLTSCVSKKKYTEALTRAAAEKSALESQLAEVQDEKTNLEGQITDLESNLNMKSEEIVSLSEEIKDGNNKIGQLKNAISDVFTDYDNDEVNVELREGKLYVTMANSILFDAGRAKITEGSEEVIAKLAGVIKDNPGLKILVEGHTDNDPVKVHKAKYGDNWGLSVARATSVVRSLADLGVDVSRLTASGKGDTQPVAGNDTDEGKEANRRTEFVIIPKVDGLWKMYKEDFAGMGEGSN